MVNNGTPAITRPKQNQQPTYDIGRVFPYLVTEKLLEA
jgi:hypothetical protein